MSLVYKNSVRENVKDIQTFIVDESAKSSNYFRVSDVPQVLQKGKNLLRITAHPTNLLEGSQVYIDVRDSNGNAIYYEIPDYLEDDKSRVISIWVYHDKGDDNTPNGEATITLAGIANVDLNGNPLPQIHRNKINVKWQTTVTVDRERDNTSDIIFNSNNLPTLVVSQSVESYQNQPQSGTELIQTVQTGKVTYVSRGNTPIIQTTDGGTFNSEMVSGSIILNNFTEPARPLTTIENPLSSTFFSSSIKEILSPTVLKPSTQFTTSFDGREDVKHTFDFIGTADYKIQYVQSGSNVSTENKRNFANLSFSNVDPITGIVDKIKVLQKSDGLPGDFELVNEVDVPFTASFDIKVPIPSKNLKDPKILKLLYLNSEGSISRTQTISKPFVFDGDNIYIGGDENLISGSIFISNTLGTGIEIGGASSGFIRSVGFDGQTSASLGKAPGGFVIYSGSGNLVMGSDQLNGVGMQFIGDNDDRHLIFTTDNGGILDVKTDKFFVGTLDTQFISGSDGNIEISSSIFHLDPAANSGDGSLIIGANATILSDLTVDNLRTPALINGASSTVTNSSSSISADGFARFVSASIGGWAITTASIEGGNLIMQPQGILQTRDFASGLKGWKISSEGNGTAEFENIRIRGTLRTTTFEKESVNAVGGQLWVANSTTITGSVGISDTTMSVKNASGFSQGEILLIKKVDNTGFQTEYVLLNSASIDGDGSNEDETGGRIMITRAYGSGSSGEFVGDLGSAAQVYEDGQVIVSTGKLNTGYIKMNANPNDTSTPFIDIVERTGSGLYDVALKARLGDLGGLANSSYVFGNSNPGFGLATDNVFLQGGIIAKTGSIGGINMDDGKLFTGGGNYNNSDTGFYVDSGSQFSLGTKLVWNPTTEALVIRGQLQLSDGTDVGTAIENVSTPTGSVARTVSLSADKYVITFDADGNEAPSNQTITLTATPQNFGVSTVYYEFYKDSSIQGSRSTTATFDVDTTLEKPTATTPKTYEVRTYTGSSGGTTVSTDSLTLFGIQPGSDGAEGQDAVTAFLTNEAHTLPLSSSGVIQSYAGADTQMKVFEGITDKTSAYTFTESSPSHITATSSSNTFTIASTTTPHSGSVTITAASGSVSLSKIMSIGTTRQGDDGTDGTPGVNGETAKTLIASVDSQVFAFDDSTDNSATPGSILFSFSQQNLSGTIAAGDITITTDDSNSVTNFSFDNNSVATGSGIVSGSVSYLGGFSSGGLNNSKDSLPLTISCTKDSLTDSVKIFKVEGGLPGSAGADAVTTFLTNESHTLPAQNNGTVVSFAGATTDMEVFEGITNVTSNYAISSSNGAGMTATDSGKTVTISGMSHDSGSVTITATSASVSLSKTMTLSKSKQGTAGLQGSDAKLLSLSSDSLVFSFPSASSSTAIDNDILLIINQQNLSGTIDAGDITIKDAGGNTLTDPTFVSSVTDGTGQVSGSITFGPAPNPGITAGGTVGADKTKLPLTIEVAKDGLEDSLKIFKVEGGTGGAAGVDAISGFLTNESHTFPADSSGSIASFTAGTTDMQVFEGITDVTNNYVISSSNGIGMGASDSGNTVTITSMAHDSGSVKITATSASVALSKTMSLTKARQGADGSDGTSAKLLIGTLDSQVMAFDSASDNSATPTSVEFSFQQQNLNATIGSGDITIALNGGGSVTNFEFNNSDVSNGTGIVSGSLSFSALTTAGGMGGNKEKFPVTITAVKDSLSDSVKVFKVEGGADGTAGTNAVTALLTNDSHTLPVSSSGNVISFAGASTDILVFQGTSDVTSEYTINTGSVSPHITTTTSGDTVTITNSTTPFSGSVVITATSASVSLSKTMSISQALQGDDGADGAPGDPGASASLISLTGDSQVFTFASSSVTTPDDNTIELFINQQNLGSVLHTSQITITDKNGDSYTTPTFSSLESPNNSGIISGSLVFGTNTPTPKAKFPITITATSESLSDSFKIFALDGGADGTAGEPAKSVALTAATQIISYNAAGSSPDVSSITLTATSQNFTNGYFKFTGGGGAFSDESSYTDGSGANSDTATFTVPTSYSSTPYTFNVSVQEGNSGGEVASDTITIASVQPGAQGADAFTVVLTNESHTLTQTSPQAGSTIDFVGSGTDIIAYKGTTQLDSVSGTPSSGQFKVTATGVGITPGSIGVSGNNAIVADHSNMLTVSASIGYDINLENTVTLAKSQSFSISQAADSGSDGSGGITVILGNESHTIAAASDGTVASFSGAETDVTIFEGVTDKTTEYFINGVGSTGVTIDNDFNSFNSSSLNVTAMGHDSGSVVITSISGGVHHSGWGSRAGENWATNQFISNAAGDINGTDNDWHLQSAAGEISVGTGDGELRNNYVEFGNNSGNDEVWIVGKDIFAYDDTKTYYLEVRFKRVAGSGQIFCGVNGWSSQSARVNKGGSNSFGSQHYFAANNFVFEDEGTDWITLRGYFSGHSSTGANNTGEAPDINTPKSVHTNAAYISPMFLCNYNDAQGKIRLDYIEIKEVKDGSGNLLAGVVKVDKTMTLAKSKAGTDGTPGDSAKTITLTSDSQVFTFASSSVTTPDDNTIELFINQQNLSGTITASDITITDSTGDDSHTVPTFAPSSLTDGTGVISGSLVFNTNTPTPKAKFPITISVTKDGVTDSTKIFTLDGGSDGTAGADAYTVILSNESHTIPQSSPQGGGARDFAGSGTDIIVYKGTSQLNSVSGTPSTNEFKVTATGTDITPGSIGVTGNPVVVANHSSMTADSASISYSINVENSATFTKLQSFTTSQAADSGSDGATGPEGPNFSFLSGSLSTINTAGGLSPGLLMTSNVFGFHKAIAQGSGPPYNNAQLTDFTSFLDSGGSFYLGGNSSGMSGSAATSGYFAWNNTDRSLLISGSKASIQVEKFFVGNSTTQFVSGSNGNLEISGSNFHLDKNGNVKVSGEITVSNPGDFADPDATATTDSVFKKFAGTGTITSDNFYIGNLNQASVTQTEGGTPFIGTRFGSTVSGGYSSGTWQAGYATKTTFTASLEPIATYDVILSDGATGASGAGATGAYHMFGFSDIDSNTDITDNSGGTKNYQHLTAGIYINRYEFDGNYYNTIEVRENGGNGVGNSDFYVVNGNIEPDGTNGPWVTGTDTFYRFVIQLKKGGGAIYKAFKNGNFLSPVWDYETTTTTHTGQHSFASFYYYGYQASYRKEIITDQLMIGSAPPAATVISGDGIKTGAIESTNLSTTQGTKIDLDNETAQFGGTAVSYTAGTGVFLDGGTSGSPKVKVGSPTQFLKYDTTSGLQVAGNISVTNAGDFADPSANVTTEAVFEKFGGVTSPIDSTNYYLGNLVQNLVTQTDGGTSFSGIKFEKNGSGNGWDAGFATKTTFTSSLEPIASIDIVLNQGVTGDTGANQYPPYQMMGFSDIDENADITTTNNFEHITHGIYVTRLQNDGSYYNTFQVRESSGASVGASDYYTVNGITPDGTNGPWVSGQDTFIRFTIQPKQSGGAIYKAFRNGNFLVPIWSYVTSTYEFTGNQSFFWSTYWAESNSNRKELIVDQISIGAAPPAGTVISGDGITAGKIVSTNLNADSGSELNLDDGSMKMGGTNNPGFEVTEEGFVTATNIAEKFVTVTTSNKSQYFVNYSSNTRTRIILDGSLGGDITMNLILECAPDYKISDFTFPSNVGANEISEVEITISTDDTMANGNEIEFDESQSNFFSGKKSFTSNLLSQYLTRNSERRLKYNIEFIGESPMGIPMYHFNYKDESHGKGRFVGTMVDDLQRLGFEDALVYRTDGIYVDYSKIDVRFKNI